jgi:N-acetylglucosaminyldiphosphoundecaprenol N-acetyl-beta-D-mannosaminyltransferase
MARVAACLILVLISPIVLMNVVIAMLKNTPLFKATAQHDALGREITLHHFSCGLLQKSALLFDIVFGCLSFSGIPLTHTLTTATQQRLLKNTQRAPGVFSLFDLHQSSGLAITNEAQLLEQQLRATFIQRQCLVLKSMLCVCFYSRNRKTLTKTVTMPLFGLNINNTTIKAAANWAIADDDKSTTKTAFYINAHSINLATSNSRFFDLLQQADTLFADGSGMRIAAKTAGYQLNDNNNGTDMLPHICARCLVTGKSLYLLGAKPGIAEKMAFNLKQQYPGLIVAGYQHGYSAAEHSDQVIDEINHSRCDILLVAMGSPMQESWILKHRDRLQCQTAMAVGGLFDFYSGQIARAPLWLRELGMEWLWRLMQEPKAKFARYVVGNPLFLFRIYCLGLARKGVK